MTCSIALISDIHIMSPLANYHSLRNVKAMQADILRLGCQHLHVGGDFSNAGRRYQYRMFFQQMRRIEAVGIHTTISLGNHDVRKQKTSNPLVVYKKAMEALYHRTLDAIYYEEKIGDIPCLMMNTEQALPTASYISKKQRNWLKERLDVYETTDTTVFICCHQPIANIHPNSERFGLGEQEEEVKAILKGRKNIVFISGHLHNNYEHVNVVETAYGIHVDLPSFHMNEHGRMKQGCGYVFKIEDKRIRIQVRNFIQQKWIGEEWIVWPHRNRVVKATKSTKQQRQNPVAQEVSI